MKDRLKKKLKSKKILGNDKHAKPSHKSKPVKNKEYPMPDSYNEYLTKLTELIDEQEKYRKMLPTMLPEERNAALPVMRELDKVIEDFEQGLADEYEDYQNRQRRIEQTQADKDEAAAILYEQIQRGFILFKHKLPAEVFKKFEDGWVGKMDADERAEFYELVAHRESYDLENILADPEGKVKRPMKHPQIQMNEALFEINRIAYVTPEEFKEIEKIYEEGIANRNKAEKKLWIMNPEHRPLKRRQIEDLDKQIDAMMPKLIDYLETCLAETGKIEVENPDQKRLDAAFEQAQIAGDRMYIMIKHVTPHLLEAFEQTSFLDLTEAEIKETRERIAKREAKELDEILKACGVGGNI